MTIKVLIGTEGNKAVKISHPAAGDLVLQPGRWITLDLHAFQLLTIQETGEFIDPGASCKYLPVVPEPLPKETP